MGRCRGFICVFLLLAGCDTGTDAGSNAQKPQEPAEPFCTQRVVSNDVIEKSLGAAVVETTGHHSKGPGSLSNTFCEIKTDGTPDRLSVILANRDGNNFGKSDADIIESTAGMYQQDPLPESPDYDKVQGLGRAAGFVYTQGGRTAVVIAVLHIGGHRMALSATSHDTKLTKPDAAKKLKPLVAAYIAGLKAHPEVLSAPQTKEKTELAGLGADQNALCSAVPKEAVGKTLGLPIVKAEGSSTKDLPAYDCRMTINNTQDEITEDVGEPERNMRTDSDQDALKSETDLEKHTIDDADVRERKVTDVGNAADFVYFTRKDHSGGSAITVILNAHGDRVYLRIEALVGDKMSQDDAEAKLTTLAREYARALQ